MTDQRLRDKERQAALGGIEDRQAWITELRRAGAPEVQAAEAFVAQLEEAFAAIRQRLDAHWRDAETETPPSTPCPELPLAPVLTALETALSVREGLEVGYGTGILAHYVPREEATYRGWCQSGVAVVAARVDGTITLAIDAAQASKPSPGTCGLSNFRESLKPKTKETKLRAWVETDREHDVWETYPVERAQLLVDLYRLTQTGAIRAPKPIAKAGPVTWRGKIVGIQPRLKLNRPDSEDEYFGVGYALRLAGNVDEEEREFVIGLGPSALEKHALRIGDTVSGVAKPVEDPTSAPVDFYRVSKLKVASRGEAGEGDAPPWHGPGPALEEYRGVTPRPLSEDAFARDPCRACHWGCRVQVADLPDFDAPLWTACFGPTSCAAYAPA